MKTTLTLLLLLACGPVAYHRGEAGQHCKPDGSCISERLECVDAPVFWGLPAEAEPSCRMKVKPSLLDNRDK